MCFLTLRTFVHIGLHEGTKEILQCSFLSHIWLCHMTLRCLFYYEVFTLFHVLILNNDLRHVVASGDSKWLQRR